MKARKVPAQARVSMPRKIAYGAGGLGDNFMSEILESYLAYFYITTLGLNPVLVGIGVMIPRLWDMITDPWVGNLSDNFRSRLGRRRPFILVGGLLACVPFTLVWIVPEAWGEAGKFAWLVGSMLVYSTFYTVYFVPYNSLGAELSTDYNERSNVASVRLFVGRIGALAMAPLFELVYNKDLFEREQVGYLVIGVFFSAVSAVGYFWLFASIRETGTAQKQEKINILKAARYTAQNRAFVLFLFVSVIGGFAFWSVIRLGRFVNVYYVHGGDEESLGRINTIAEFLGVFVAFASILIINWMCRHFGKLTTRIVVSVITMVLQASSWFLFNPDHPELYIVFAALAGMTQATYIVNLSMMADVADADELASGRRREGMYFGVWGLVQKISFSLGPLITGAILALIGFQEGVDQQPEDSLFWMRAIFAFGGIPVSVVTILILLRYPLTESRVRELRAILDERNKAS